MKLTISRNRRGLTLVELMLAAMMASIVILGTGVVLVDNHRGWQNTYNRVYGNVVTGGYAAKRAFDAVVRKSSESARRPELGLDGEFVEVYYYEDLSSAEPDSYARFYLAEAEELKIAYGELDETTGVLLEPSSTVTLAHNVKNASFWVAGTTVQMKLSLDNSRASLTVTSSAIRHAR